MKSFLPAREQVVYYTFFIFAGFLFISSYFLSAPCTVYGDNVTVNATVTETITCTSSGSPSTFNSLSPSAVSTSTANGGASNTTTTLSCNSANGCLLTVSSTGNGTNGGLYKSSAPTDFIESTDASFNATATLVAGTEGYGIQIATTSDGSGSTLGVSTSFSGHFDTSTVARLTTTSVTLASSTSPTSGRLIRTKHKAAVSALTRAGAYTDVIAYSCSANP